ncbi:hypothetical protein LPJ81_004486 [Coemansia sp. IMI 209127]|nr:hypothetical protein LPJ81_004486 [Coemansia sp. IMI 209127]
MLPSVGVVDVLKQIYAACDTRSCYIALLSALGAAAVYRVAYSFFFSPLRNIRGPWLARLTSLRADILIASGFMWKLARNDFAEYGDLFVTMPDAVTVCDPDDIRMLLGNPTVNKASFYRILKFTGIENTLSYQNNADALVRHRQIGPFLKTGYLSKMEDTIMREGVISIKNKWDKLLDESPSSAVEVNYSDDFTIGVFGIISTLVYGRKIKELNDNSADTAIWIKKSLSFLGTRSMVNMLPSFVSRILLSPWEHYYTRLSNYTHESISQRKSHLNELETSGKDNERPTDLLQALIDAEDAESKSKMSYDEIHSECLLMMQAGTDTTSQTISTTLHLLLLHPHYHNMAVDEVRSQFSPDHVVTYNECRDKLPFLEACFFESLRLEPVTGGILGRTAPKGGVTIKGQFIPEGTSLLVNLAAANRHSRHWDRPLEFDPTRFIGNRDARNKIMTFSYGRRACPGRQLAWWEMLTILANVLKDYDLKVPSDCTHFGPDVLGENGYPKTMDWRMFITIKPENSERDCRVLVSRATTA